MKIDRWSAHWSQRRVLLRFASGASTAAIALSPEAAKELGTQLHQAVQTFENEHGTLWCEQHRLHGQRTDRCMDGARLLNGDSDARRVYQLIRNLPLTGFERSFKMRQGQLDSGRFLVGFPVKAMADADIDYLASQLGAPLAYRAAIAATLAQANFVHVGFEPGDGQRICKMYLEFPEPQAAGQPLYIGYKWDLEETQQQAVSHYVPTTMPGKLALVDPEACASLQDILGLATERVLLSALRYVEVTDQDTQRMSFDINLYPAGLRMRDLRPMLAALQHHFSIPDKAMTALMEHMADDVVGHVSAGTDRHGRAFVTVYHARPEALAPA
ncbi:hypothetical protein GCM10022212_02050 [Actimicrobium antarcticum]|uniref:ATP-grasp domain-containing protein n=2 Tax=Actimicrobium antarcticum TaxID=1051899 RepID=A0ABP7SII3_9BURK